MDTSREATDRVIHAQRAWAKRNDKQLIHNDHYLASPDEAFRAGRFSSQLETELVAGAGPESDRLHSLWSSTCLAANFFDPRRADPGPIAAALGCRMESPSSRFEALGTPP